MRNLAFVQVDVFTSHAFEGNQLAVLMDASGLDTEQMQAIAREMNLSETTFVIPRSFEEERDHGHRVRIFTVNEELPFAGHPTLGTAWVLRQASGAPEFWLDLNVGRIPVQFTTDEHGEVFGEMQQRDPEFGAVHSAGGSCARAWHSLSMNWILICRSRLFPPVFPSPWSLSARLRRYRI